MTPRIITVDVAHAMAAKWKGYDGPYGVSWDDDGDCVIHYDDITIARVAHFDNGHTEALAHLFAVAPDDVKELSATVIAQAAENDALKAQVDAQAVALRVVALWIGGPHHPSDAESVSSLARANGSEIERLRAIVDGRTTPPTEAEIAAHEAAGGWWRCAPDGDRRGLPPLESFRSDTARAVTSWAYVMGHTIRWWALDAQGRPCAWPVVKAKR